MNDPAELLERALREVRDGIDAIPTVGEALAALRIECGELPSTELDDQLGDAESCTCPRDLAARGGYRSSCPSHGVEPDREPVTQNKIGGE